MAANRSMRGRCHLRDHVEVGDEGGLEDDRDVGGVEELDGVAGVLPPVAGRLDRQVHTEALKKGDEDHDDDKDDGGGHGEVPDADLEVDDHSEDEDGGSEVHEVGQVLAVEGLAECTHLKHDNFRDRR